MNQPDDPGIGPLDEPDPFDPTGYYARKAKHREEMLPYVGACIVASVLIVCGVMLWRLVT